MRVAVFLQFLKYDHYYLWERYREHVDYRLLQI